MSKDSQYYKDKSRDQKLKLRELLSDLPQPAVDFIYDHELTSQPGTLVAYAYDLLVFFRFLREQNPYFAKIDIVKVTAEDLSNLSSEDIVEYQRYLELNLNGEKHENAPGRHHGHLRHPPPGGKGGGRHRGRYGQHLQLPPHHSRCAGGRHPAGNGGRGRWAHGGDRHGLVL